MPAVAVRVAAVATGTRDRRIDGPTRRELLVALMCALFLVITIGTIKVQRINEQQGDDAIFYQLTENVAHRGVTLSEVFANTQAFLESGLLTATAQQIAQAPLAPPQQTERDMLRFHAYFVLYPMALAVLVLPAPIALLTLHAICYVGLLLLAYVFLRMRGVDIASALVFGLLVTTIPAWSSSLLSGQFYPDRLFVVTGFALMWLTAQHTIRFRWIALAAVACAAVNERAALLTGFFLIAWTIADWFGLTRRRRIELITLGAACAIYGVVMVKLVLTNAYYSSFLPGSIGGIIQSFALPGFADHARFFILINAPLLLLALFAPRAAVIAFIFMIPNVIGNIGGAEKVGWATPYHSYYLPALVWAAANGFAAADGALRRRRLAFAVTAVTAALAVLLASIDPFTPDGLHSRPANIAAGFIPAWSADVAALFSPGAGALPAAADRIRLAVPLGAVVTTLEQGMPILYHGRRIRVFPIDIERADYAVLAASAGTAGALTFSGVSNFLAPPEPARVNAVIIERMRRDGYDFAHPVLVPELGLAVVARNHAVRAPQDSPANERNAARR